MKIAMIGHKRIPSREGGVEIVVEELATRMAAAGHSVSVYNRSGHHVSGREHDAKAAREYRGVRVITVPTPSGKALNALVSSLLSSIGALFSGCDLIHYHAEGPCLFLWIPHLFGIPTVATIHGLDWQRAKWNRTAKRVLLSGEAVAARYADAVIVLSESMRSYFLHSYGRACCHIPNAVPAAQQKPARRICEKWGLARDEYILFLGRIVPEKGVTMLLSAFSRLKTDKKLVIAGGSSHSDAYCAAVRAAAEADPRVIMTGFVEGEALEELFSNPYLYVLPSEVEGMPLSLMEALSYGQCCLISDIPENLEAAEGCAASFAHGSEAELARQLEALLSQPQLVSDYRQRAASRAARGPDWDEVAQRTLGVYRSCLAKRRCNNEQRR